MENIAVLRLDFGKHFRKLTDKEDDEINSTAAIIVGTIATLLYCLYF
jgi:hypothetical protein